MKKISLFIFSVILFAFFRVSFAQSLSLDGIIAFESTLLPLDKGYAFVKKGKKNKGMRPFLINYYDWKLQKTSVEFDIPAGMGLKSLTFNGEIFLSVFLDIKEKTYTYYVHDMEGNELGKKIDPLNKVSESAPEVRYSDTDGFYFFRTIKQEKWGYRIEKVNSNLESVWTHEYIPEKKYAYYTLPTVNKNGLAFLRPQTESLTGSHNRAGYDLVILDKNTGEMSGTYSLLKSGFYLEPNTLVINEDYSVVIGGMFFNNTKEKNFNSDGVYLAKVNRSGKQVFLKTLPWDDKSNGLADLLYKKGKKQLIFTSDVACHHISQQDDKYFLIFEAYKKASSGLVKAVNIATSKSLGGIVGAAQGKGDVDEGDVDVTLMDFLLLTFDSEGSLIGKSIVNKPEHSVTQKSSEDQYLIATSGIDFDFQFVSKDDIGVVFQGTVKKKLLVHRYFGFFPIKYQDEQIQPKEMLFEQKGKKFDGKATTKLYPNDTGKALLWEYYPSKFKLFLEVIDFSGN
ncbi:MAG: hypothetical protein AAGC64_11935 [Bacteroidota bacterium]